MRPGQRPGTHTRHTQSSGKPLHRVGGTLYRRLGPSTLAHLSGRGEAARLPPKKNEAQVPSTEQSERALPDHHVHGYYRPDPGTTPYCGFTRTYRDHSKKLGKDGSTIPQVLETTSQRRVGLWQSTRPSHRRKSYPYREKCMEDLPPLGLSHTQLQPWFMATWGGAVAKRHPSPQAQRKYNHTNTIIRQGSPPGRSVERPGTHKFLERD